MPTRFAMRELKLTYLDQVQTETTNFLNERIKHDFLRPDRDLSLDLTVREAEILISANQEVRDFADKGDLRALHNKFHEVQSKVESDYLAVREQLAKTLQVIEAKENEIYTQASNDFGFSLKLHGDYAPLLDVFGLSSRDGSFENLSTIEGAIEKGVDGADQLRNARGWLHSYMGVKTKIYDIDARLKEQYAN
jgi:hypothetical protein